MCGYGFAGVSSHARSGFRYYGHVRFGFHLRFGGVEQWRRFFLFRCHWHIGGCAALLWRCSNRDRAFAEGDTIFLFLFAPLLHSFGGHPRVASTLALLAMGILLEMRE